jgi:predicted permease
MPTDDFVRQGRSNEELTPVVVGVMPAGESFLGLPLGSADCWLPTVLHEGSNPRARYLPVVARLRTGVSVDAARSAMNAVARQLLTETLLVSLTAGGVGLVLASASVRALVALAPPTLPRAGDIMVDGHVYVFGLLVSMFTAAACGILPALRASRVDLSVVLNDAARATPGRRRAWLSHALVVSQVALALVLLIGAGLMLRTFGRLHATNLGFEVENVLTVGLSPSRVKYPDLASRRPFYDEVIARIERLPGVEAAAIGGNPMRGSLGTALHLEGDGEKRTVSVDVPGPHYFRALRIPVLQGRVFNESDTGDSEPVAIVSRTAAARFWPGETAVGQRITEDQVAEKTPIRWLTVVGVVEDVRSDGVEHEPGPRVYLPFAQQRTFDPLRIVLRTTADPRAIVAAVRNVVRSVDRDQAMGPAETLSDHLAGVLAPRRFNLFVIGVFSILACVLAAVGVYGVVSQVVSMRTREIGTRVALGARRVDVFRLVVRRTVWMVLLGVALGLGMALTLNRLMTTMVYGVATTDPGTYVTVSLAWATVAVAASLGPARRATRIDPIVALRCE